MSRELLNSQRFFIATPIPSPPPPLIPYSLTLLTLLPLDTAPGTPTRTISAHATHLPRHAQPGPLPRLQRLPPPLRIPHGRPVPLEPEDLHQLRDLGVVARRAHAMAPRDALLLHPLIPPILIPITKTKTKTKSISVFLFSSFVPHRRRRRQDRRLERPRSRLEKELAANLSLIAHLEREARAHLPQPLEDPRRDVARRRAVAQVRGARAHLQRPHHAEVRVEPPGRVRVHGEQAGRLAHVCVDELVRPAAHDYDEGARGKPEEGLGGYGG